jgi:hypothetical protein
VDFQDKTWREGEIGINKAKVVAKSYVQEYDVNYDEASAHVVKKSLIRLLLAVAVEKNLDLEHLAVKAVSTVKTWRKWCICSNIKVH